MKPASPSLALGICVGASSVSAVTLRENSGKIELVQARTEPHHGNPKETVRSILENEVPNRIAVTGKKFRKFIQLSSLSEAEAVENAYHHLGFESDIIISAGGENFIVYVMDKDRKISKVLTGNKCASGTGEFFLQQLKRMDLDLQEAADFSETGSPYAISGRCSVFCKSDCTHALNKGVEKANVVAGLSRMMANKIVELTSRIPHERALMIGGTSGNKGMVKFLHEHFREIEIPEQAAYFEAFGTALHALRNETRPLNRNRLFHSEQSVFEYHDPLRLHLGKVHFKETPRGKAEANDNCILGLDVGSTTTKAVLLRCSDDKILAAEYLRTNGDPVAASIACYTAIRDQVDVPIKITGLGVTGSGRQIAGLHALTKGIINEIIAHATATIHFDPEVDTIFEIGGQDAKYTFITSGVASDYAMNEACSAGTGSFLEEAAKESLDINYLEIGDIAMQANQPPNFNDQCSAFISSDIKNAFHEGLSRDDIIAGLVYSICLNFINRVKGHRPVGKKVFMQGGVCYNKAVPVAMAALTGKEIIVPPDPGLMGAFGVALEIKHRINLGLMQEAEYDLDTLINRKVTYEKSFICMGGKEHCDRKCNVSMINVAGKKYPFGGACNKYYNLQLDVKRSGEDVDYVRKRMELVFETYPDRPELPANAKTIGIPKSLLTNTLYPLYHNFFTRLGFRVILADEPKHQGIDKKEAPFCYPVELAHGFFQNAIDRQPDYLFVPHIIDISTGDSEENKKCCPFVQSENYYLRTTFKKELEGRTVLSPQFRFAKGYASQINVFSELAVSMGCNRNEAKAAYLYAVDRMKSMLEEFRHLGREAISKLEKDPERTGMVLFGRVYNSFAKEANLGIPQKFASRDILLIPHDFLPSENETSYKHMYWGSGQQILMAARFVKNHPQLFGTYITNFSCGPDAFLVGYFRNIMGMKPSLTLELDSHSADAGINTRIEAAMDIIRSYRELEKSNPKCRARKAFQPMEYLSENQELVDSEGMTISLRDPLVKIVVPPMGNLNSQAFAAAFRHLGFNSIALPASDARTLVIGRGNTSCKECIPLILIAGAMIQYYEQRDPNERTLFFMAASDGPCRFGQYEIFLADLIRKREMENTALLGLNEEDSYGGLGNKFVERAWTNLTVAGAMNNIRNAIEALAINKAEGLQIFEEEWYHIHRFLDSPIRKDIDVQLDRSATRLSEIDLKVPITEAKKVSLIGEIYVRNDDYSRMDLMKRLAEHEFVVQVAPIGEFVYYTNHLAKNEISWLSKDFFTRLGYEIRDRIQIGIEKDIMERLGRSGLLDFHFTSIEEIIRHADHLIKPEMESEALLTVGSALLEVNHHVCGVISIGPFGCMPSRIAESILNVEMNSEGKAKADHFTHADFRHNGNYETYPFLSIETDGNLFPQIIQSKIEIFMLQAERLHQKMQERKKMTVNLH